MSDRQSIATITPLTSSASVTVAVGRVPIVMAADSIFTSRIASLAGLLSCLVAVMRNNVVISVEVVVAVMVVKMAVVAAVIVVVSASPSRPLLLP